MMGNNLYSQETNDEASYLFGLQINVVMWFMEYLMSIQIPHVMYNVSCDLKPKIETTDSFAHHSNVSKRTPMLKLHEKK